MTLGRCLSAVFNHNPYKDSSSIPELWANGPMLDVCFLCGLANCLPHKNQLCGYSRPFFALMHVLDLHLNGITLRFGITCSVLLDS